MASSQQQRRRGSQLLLLAAALALVLLIAAESADAMCNSPYSECNGKCVDCKSDLYNCGWCGHYCKPYPNTVAKCYHGDCKWECKKGYGNCDNNIKNGCLTKVSSDYKNCGWCGHKCELSEDYKHGEVYCSWGECKSRCKSGWKYNHSGKYCYQEHH